MITSECINCGACEPECPNVAIYQGGVEWEWNGVKNAAISNEIFYIVPDKCTECVGFFDHEACAAVCPVDACVPNPEIPEAESVLIARAAQLHPEKAFGGDFPSRFRAAGGEGAGAPPAAATTPAAAPVAAAPAGPARTVAVSPEDALAAQVPEREAWEVPLRCFRCKGEFTVEFQYLKPGGVLHCPHCSGSFVPNTAMYQAIASRLRRFYESWEASLEEFRTRRARELEQFETAQQQAIATLKADIEASSHQSELAGAPTRNRGFFG